MERQGILWISWISWRTTTVSDRVHCITDYDGYLHMTWIDVLFNAGPLNLRMSMLKRFTLCIWYYSVPILQTKRKIAWYIYIYIYIYIYNTRYIHTGIFVQWHIGGWSDGYLGPLAAIILVHYKTVFITISGHCMLMEDTRRATRILMKDNKKVTYAFTGNDYISSFFGRAN